MTQTAPFYANRFYVSYRRDEFYTELARINPEGEQERIELYMSPYQAKGLRDALSSMISEYEGSYGEIPAMEIGKVEPEEPTFDSKAEPALYR